MNEIEAIRWHLNRYRAVLAQQIDRLNNALEELQRTTLLLLSLNPDPEENIDAWLQAEDFAVDEDGFFQSRTLLDAFRKGIAPADAISFSWGQNLRTDSRARRHLYCHRAIGPHLKHIHDRLGDVGWIYYQDAGNTALQYPHIDQRTAISSDFDWRTYHTYLSVCPENNPERQIQWTAPTIDYAGEGLILSVSIPVWRNDVFIGLWSIDLPIRYLYRDFALTKPFPDQMQFIVNQKGLLLLHDNLHAEVDQPKGQVILHSLKELGGQWADFELDTILAKEGDVLPMTDVAGTKWIFCYTHVPGVEWTFFCGLPESSMEEVAVEGLRQAFQQIGDGNFSYRVESPSRSYSNLVAEFNEMSLRLSQAEQHRATIENQLRGAQKMEAIGRLAGGVAHDYNNMINVIMGYAEMALEQLGEGDQIYRYIQQIYAAGRRSMDLTHQLLAFARCQTVAPKVLDINQAVSSMLNMLQRLIGEDVELIWNPCGQVWPIEIDPSQIDQILANLCVNARDAISGVGKVLIETANIEVDEAFCVLHPGLVPGEYVQMVVSDNGMGIDGETIDKIFEPFFSTKAIGQGTGLGLATVYGIVRQNQGMINVRSEPGVGTSFTVYLPRAIGQSLENQSSDPVDMPCGHNETLLLVEDEISILELVETMLKQLGYRVLVANSPTEAIHIAEQHPETIDLMVSDVIMPELNGRDLADRIRILFPGLPVLYMSGYTANIITDRGFLDKDVCLIQKPFSKKELAIKVREVLTQTTHQYD